VVLLPGRPQGGCHDDQDDDDQDDENVNKEHNAISGGRNTTVREPLSRSRRVVAGRLVATICRAGGGRQQPLKDKPEGRRLAGRLDIRLAGRAHRIPRPFLAISSPVTDLGAASFNRRARLFWPRLRIQLEQY
jgi:hypothetical protein